MTKAEKQEEKRNRAERIKTAINLRLAGATYDVIAEHLGITRQAAWQLILRHLLTPKVDSAESLDQLRDVELLRIDRLQAAHWGAAMKGDVQATDRVLKLMTRRAEMLGLDAPKRTDVTTAGGPLTVEAYDYGAAIAALAPRPVSNSDAPGESESNQHGAPVG